MTPRFINTNHNSDWTKTAILIQAVIILGKTTIKTWMISNFLLWSHDISLHLQFTDHRIPCYPPFPKKCCSNIDVTLFMQIFLIFNFSSLNFHCSSSNHFIYIESLFVICSLGTHLISRDGRIMPFLILTSPPVPAFKHRKCLI